MLRYMNILDAQVRTMTEHFDKLVIETIMATQTSFCDIFCEVVNTDNIDGSHVTNTGPRALLMNLKISADQGCLRCRLLYEACVGLYPCIVDRPAQVRVRPSMTYDGLLEIDLRATENFSIDPDRDMDQTAVYISYLNGSNPPDWMTVSSRRRPLTCRKDQYQELLLNWLSDCQGAHTSCGSTEQPLPTRVVDVGNGMDEAPFLHVSSGDQGRYIALSHCWGDAPSIETKMSNITEFRKTISFVMLPKLYQDVITVARTIGIRYIWIDSLCIIQDDKTDWETESSTMAAIYQNADVVVLASNAADSRDGLWDTSWDDYGQSAGVKEFLYTNDDQSTSQLIARKNRTHIDEIPEFYLEYEAPSPLSKRAWTLQEELLASRCIYFTGKELLWRCRSAQRCECMQEDIDNVLTGTGKQNVWEGIKSDSVVERFGNWRSLMAIYSRRSITHESDRLSAISGMARCMQSIGTGEYLAGFWRDDLLESLCWLPRPIYPYIDHDNHVSTYRRRAPSFLAPTWSWISLETTADIEGKPRCPGIIDWRIHADRSWRILAKVIDAQCEPTGIDPTGAVKSGYILLRCKCLEAWVVWKDRNSPIYIAKIPLTIHWDIDLDDERKQKVFCAYIRDELVDGSADRERLVSGLVLRRSIQVANTFERIGLFQGKNLRGKRFDLLAEAHEALLTIV